MSRDVGWAFATVVGLELLLAAGLCFMVWVLVVDPWDWIESKTEAHAREKEALENQVAALEMQAAAWETKAKSIANVLNLASDWRGHLEAFSNQLAGVIAFWEESTLQKDLEVYFQNVEINLARLEQEGQGISRQVASLPGRGDLSKLESDIRSLGDSVSAVKTDLLPSINRRILNIQTNWLPVINRNILSTHSNTMILRRQMNSGSFAATSASGATGSSGGSSARAGWEYDADSFDDSFGRRYSY